METGAKSMLQPALEAKVASINMPEFIRTPAKTVRQDVNRHVREQLSTFYKGNNRLEKELQIFADESQMDAYLKEASALTAGGDGKGQDFSPLAAPVARYARAVVLIGRDAPLIREEIKACGVPLLDASTLPEAVSAAKDIAQAGDAVLLSPACASFDMFRDYPHRAQVFCQAVAEIAEAAGQVMEAAL